MRKEYPLTKEECIKIGGHCFEISNEVVLTNPPIYHRICKHCGYKEEGTQRDSFNWHEDN